MNIGQKIMEGIIEGNLIRTECAHEPEHGCITVWSSGAAEQIEALAQPDAVRCSEWLDALETALRCTTYYREYILQEDVRTDYQRAEALLTKAIATERSRASNKQIS